MAHKIYVPAFLTHLKVHTNGYPIPYFVAYTDGKPDFRLLDLQKQSLCILHKKCAVCGKKLFKGAYYFISGPMGYTNKVATDPAMHRECAEYSLKVCPHLHLEKAQIRNKGIEELREQQSGWHADEKAKTVLLVKADKFERRKAAPGEPDHLISFRPLSYEIYVYENGELVKLLMAS